MSRPFRPHRSMMASTELTNASLAAVVVSWTCPFAPPREISTLAPAACLALIAARKSASLSTFGHSDAEHRTNWIWPEVGEVGSPKARSMTSQSDGTSAIRRYPEPLAKLACRYPTSAWVGSPPPPPPPPPVPVVADTGADRGLSPAPL